MTDDDVGAMLAVAGLAAERAFLTPFAHVELALVPAAGGRTRLGGGCDAPDDFAWPHQRWSRAQVATWPDYARAEVDAARARGEVRDEGDALAMPLSFLAQVDLAEVRACDPGHRLPANGRLLFFASSATDVADPRFAKRVASAVRWIAGDGPRAHAQPPTPDPHPQAPIALRVARRLHLALPWDDQVALMARLLDEDQRRFVVEASRPGDALFPAPADELVGAMPPPGEIALARIVDHGEVGLHIGDASWLTFAIPEAALAARRFDEARASVFIG